MATPDYPTELDNPIVSDEASPQHGFQGDRAALSPPALPAGPAIALSRDVGARGGPIARRIGEKLGWQVFDREMIEFMLRDAGTFDALLAESPPGALEWAASRLKVLVSDGRVIAGEAEALARVILTIGARGNVVIVGRGAGFLLPRRTTLHARITAPQADRIAYLGQWLRLPRDEAATQLRVRATRRAEFLAACLRLPPDTVPHDLVLNSSRLGVELCADLLIHTVKCRPSPTAPPSDEPPGSHELS